MQLQLNLSRKTLPSFILWLSLLGCTWITCDGAANITAFITEEQIVLAGSNVTITCRAEISEDNYDSNDFILWYTGDSAIASDFSTQTYAWTNTTLESNLTIGNVSTEDSGNYSCLVEDMETAALGERSTSASVSVTVEVAPEVTMAEQEVTVNRTDPAVFTCNATGVPRPDVYFIVIFPTWSRYYHYETFLNQTLHYEITEIIEITGKEYKIQNRNILIEAKLIVYNVDYSHKGYIYCEARNKHGSASGSARLRVQYPPSITSFYVVEGSIVTTGSNIRIKCNASSYPSSTVTWYLDNKDLSSSLVLTTEDPFDDYYGGLVQTHSTVNISNATTRHSGTYTCEATNLLGTTCRNITITVEIAPEVTMAEQEVTVNETDIAVFACNVTGVPRPDVEFMVIFPTWSRFFSYDTYRSTERVGITGKEYETPDNLFFIEAKLIIYDINYYQNEDIHCEARNKHGSASGSARLRVQYPPRITSFYVVEGSIATTGSNITIKCDATSYPSSTVTWYQDNKELSSSLVQTTEDPFENYYGGLVRYSTVSISNSETRHSGTYTCEATNLLGTTRRNTTITVETFPTVSMAGEDPVTVNISDGVAIFACTATGVPRPDVYFYVLFGNNPNTYSYGQSHTRYSADEEVTEYEYERSDKNIVVETQFIILNLNRYNRRSIRCVASNKHGIVSAWATLSVQYPPSITSFYVVGASIAITGSNITIKCNASSYPNSTVTWYQDNKELSSSLVHTTEDPFNEYYNSLVQTHSTVSISNATTRHSGPYTCEAANLLGTTRRNITITVEIAPEVTMAEQEVTVNSSDIAVLTCNATGVPRPDVEFVVMFGHYTEYYGYDEYEYENDFAEYANATITGNEYKTSDRNIVIVAEFIVLNLNYYNRRYINCTASNRHGTAYDLTRLSVQYPPSITSLHVIGFSIVTTGSNIAIKCEASSYPNSAVTWYLDNKELPYSLVQTTEDPFDDYNSSSVIQTHSSVSISNATTRHGGTYTCEATNLLGTTRRNITITVETAPKVTSLESYVYTTLPQSARLTCIANGVPRPTITWRTNGTGVTIGYKYSTRENETLAEDKTIQVESVLTLSQTTLDDTGYYTCHATNNVGSDEYAVIILTIQHYPNAPSDVTVKNITNGERYQIVTWMAPFDGNSPIIAYQLFISSNGSEFYEELPGVWLEGAVNEYNASNLVPYVNYRYQVVAINAFGSSRRSEPSPLFRTRPAVPDYPPHSCRLSSVSSSSISVTWAPPYIPNGNILRYAIAYKPEKAIANYNPSLYESVKALTVNRSSYEMAGLQEAVEYLIEISAINQVGQGPSFMCIGRTLESEPGPPQSVKAHSPTSTSIVVSWDHPAPQDQNGIILNYTILSQLDDNITFINTNNNETVLALNGLDVFTTYTISVKASTAVGAGVASLPIQIKTLNDTSSAPLCVNLSDATNQTLSVSWYAPTGERGDITDYKVRYAPWPALGLSHETNATELQWSTCHTPCTNSPPCTGPSTGQHCCTIANLRPITIYWVVVAAISEAGLGEWSQPPQMHQTDVTIIQKTSTVQMFIHPISSCSRWSETNQDSKIQDIQRTIASEMRGCQRCNVLFTANKTVFSCLSTESEVAVLIELSYSYAHNSIDTPLSLLQSWIAGNPTMNIEQSQFRVNGTCQVEIVEVIPQCTIKPSEDNASLSVGIIAGVVASLALILLGIGAVPTVVCIAYRLHKKKIRVPIQSQKEEYEFTNVTPNYHTNFSGRMQSTIRCNDDVKMDRNPVYDVGTLAQDGDNIYDTIPGDYIYENTLQTKQIATAGATDDIEVMKSPAYEGLAVNR